MNILSGNYKSADQIVSNGTILSGPEVIFDAKNSITLTMGFHTQNNSNFTTKIGTKPKGFRTGQDKSCTTNFPQSLK